MNYEVIKMAAFFDELEKIGWGGTIGKFLYSGAKQIGTGFKGIGAAAKNVGWGYAAKKALPGAALLGGGALAGYGALKGVQGVLGGNQQR